MALLCVGACGDNEFGEGPHTPLPQVVDQGGPVIRSPRIVAVTFPGDPLAPQIDAFVAALGHSDYWTAVVNEYGVGAASAVSVHVPDAAPSTLDQVGAQLYVLGHVNPPAPGWPAPDASTVYVLFYPSTTVFSDCASVGAYHSSVSLARGQSVSYAVVPRCLYGIDSLEQLTEYATHELAEATTDPDLAAPAYSVASDFAWQSRLGGGEVGDMCQFTPGVNVMNPELGHVVQRIWSNAEAAAGHDPCVPHPAGDVYFQAAPDLDPMVTLSLSGGRTVATPGLQIPIGASRTIAVDLFSDGPTSPISVAAEQWPIDPARERPGSLDLSWDRTTGNNNDTLHLTITVNADDYGEGHEYVLISSMVGDLRQEWPVLIQN